MTSPIPRPCRTSQPLSRAPRMLGVSCTAAFGVVVALGVAIAPANLQAAPPKLVISGANFRPLPIAIVRPTDGGGAAQAIQVADEVLRSDLAISGLFDVLDPKSFLGDPVAEGLSAASIKFANWSNVGAQSLIKGSA